MNDREILLLIVNILKNKGFDSKIIGLSIVKNLSSITVNQKKK